MIDGNKASGGGLSFAADIALLGVFDKVRCFKEAPVALAVSIAIAFSVRAAAGGEVDGKREFSGGDDTEEFS